MMAHTVAESALAWTDLVQTQWGWGTWRVKGIG